MERNKEIFLIYLSEDALRIGKLIEAYFRDIKYFRYSSEAKGKLREIWREGNLLIFVMALGIVARICKDLIGEKGRDPSVLVIDEGGRHVISYLGGHYGCANRIAQELATYLRAIPVITTASDIKNLPSLDLWIQRQELVVKNKEFLPKVMAKLNTKRELNFYIEPPLKFKLPSIFRVVQERQSADVVITFYKEESKDRLILVPKCLWLGIGFHNCLTMNDLEDKIIKALRDQGLEELAIKGVATLEQKTSFEPLRTLTQGKGWQLKGFSKEELSQVSSVQFSEIVNRAVGTGSVSEASAHLASRGKLLSPKRIYQDFTIAIAVEEIQSLGKLYIVGIGPGDKEYLTVKALKVLSSVEAVVGYKTYLKQIEELLVGKEVYSFSMTEEVKRVKKAIELVLSGRDTALVSGGDPGIYGIAGLVLELLEENKLKLEVEIIPGISALNIGNALVGAPLTSDFAVVSLSDRLTPLSEIERRLKILAELDVPIVIYNPRSKSRKKPLERALEILLSKKPPNTPCALINSATREEEEIIITPLSELPVEKVNMQSLIIVGGKKTELLGRYLVTRRGYHEKYPEEYEISIITE
ncbi:MAG: precorrin-3B C(17)-methyltransferase [Caldimicrobium sp.]|nr:precorrin-3B C(17)-methyltransferase [Caldimicrobium sp.]MCX7874316.1 precorrin-3B C(17)-methyltransferase [Caldimicrobium sp.]MDW8094922.1 precorrin-3B C(17)-methyltransferase [Caldimicrobium sp.]